VKDETLEELNSASQKILRLANDPNTPLGEIERLSYSDDALILRAVASNPSTPIAVLKRLAGLGNEDVSSALDARAKSMVHSTAIVSPSAVLGHDVAVGAYTIIYGNVVIGDGAIIGSHCEIGCETPLAEGKPLIIGGASLIRSHSIFYVGSTFGDGLATGHHVTVREKTEAGKDLQIGTLCDIQGHCTIGDYVRFHSNVHIGQHSKIGSYVWIFPYVVLTNDPHPPSHVVMGVALEDFVAIATMSIVLPGVTVKKGALVGAHSSVAKDVGEDCVVAGSPAQYICATSKLKLKDGSGSSAYPWRKHFHRGYPEKVVQEWLREFS
jgi:acetyltransferase-like isoleucine patch superfamily enzyme